MELNTILLLLIILLVDSNFIFHLNILPPGKIYIINPKTTKRTKEIKLKKNYPSA